MSGRARVIVQEWDQSTRVPSFPGVVVALVGPFLKGDVNDTTYNTNETQYLDNMTPDSTVKVGYDLSHYSGTAALEKTDSLITVRAANSPLYGGAYLAQDLPIEEVGVTITDGNDMINLRQATPSELIDAQTWWSSSYTADKVKIVSDGGVVPTPLSDATTYYLIKFNEEDYQVRFALTADDAEAGIHIPLDDSGTGTITIDLVGTNTNGSAEYGMETPTSYVLDSSDGKEAGLTSVFTVDVTLSAFDVSAAFYAMVETGDDLTLTAVTFPTVSDTPVLDGVTTYYLIKMAESNMIQIARSLVNANAGTYIELLDTGDTVAGTLSSKSDDSDFTDGSINTTLDTIVIDANFWNAAVNDDKVQLTSTGTLPTPLATSTDYYIIKGVANLIQLSASVGGAAIDITAAVGGGTHTVTMQDKLDNSSFLADLSNDSITVDATFYGWISTKDKIQVSSTGTLPSGLVASTDYYVTKTVTTNILKLSTSVFNVDNEVYVDIADAGIGIHTIANFQNQELFGAERKILLIYGKDPGTWNNDIYIETLHYPYGESSTWTEAQAQAALTVKEEDSFLIYVQKRDSQGVLYDLEDPWLVSRVEDKKDGYGKNIYIESVLEGSNYIRALDNKSVDDSIYPEDQDTPLVLDKGDNGGTVTDTHMLQAIEVLRNKRNIFFTLLTDGGWATPAYQKQGIINICEDRMDCFGVLSTPISDELSNSYLEDIMEYRLIELNANTSYAGIFSPHLLIQDKYNDRQIYVPPDGYVSANISETAGNYELWYPTAGNKRGILNVLGVAREFTEGDENTLYNNGINPIDFYPGKGIRIWGNKTLLSRPSALDRINVRMLLIVIEPAIAAFLDDFVFDLITTEMYSQIRSGINTYMDDIKARNGVYDYYCVCGTENNSAQDIDNNIVNVWLYVKPVKAAEFIKFRVIITPTSASFSVA